MATTGEPPGNKTRVVVAPLTDMLIDGRDSDNNGIGGYLWKPHVEQFGKNGCAGSRVMKFVDIDKGSQAILAAANYPSFAVSGLVFWANTPLVSFFTDNTINKWMFSDVRFTIGT